METMTNGQTTTVELIDQAVERLKGLQTEGQSGNRELALAITNLEQAQMWATRGIAIRTGQFEPADLELRATASDDDTA